MAQLVKKQPDNAGDSKHMGSMPLVRKILCRRKWHPPIVFFPGRLHGQRTLVGYSPCSHKESNTTEDAHTLTHEIRLS